MMDKNEREILVNALKVIKGTRFIPHVYSNMAYNSREYTDAVDALVKLSGDNEIREKAQHYALKWEERLKERGEKDLKESTKNGTGKTLKILGGCLFALAAIGTTAGIVHHRRKKNEQKKTGE